MYRLKNTLIILFIILLVNGSCKNSFRKDLSLTVKEYQSKGMPDIDTIWSEDKLMKAHITLGSIRTKNFRTLPVKNSKKSGAVFSRIISKENLSFLNDSSKSLHDKAYQIQSVGPFLNEIGRMYTDNFRSEQYYSEELIDIYISEMYVRKRMLELAEEIMNSKEPEDISMQAGRPAIVNGYVNLITTLIGQQNNTKAFSGRELKKLNREVSRSITENMQYLDSENKQIISAEIMKITEKSSSRYIWRNFRKVLKALAS